MKIINRAMHSSFYKLGVVVARNPKKCIALSLILTLGTGLGGINFRILNDFDSLMMPNNGKADNERKIIEKYFKLNESTYFSPSRITRMSSSLRVIVTNKDESDILNLESFAEIKELDKLIMSVTVTDETETKWNYSSLCSKWKGECEANHILELDQLLPDFLQNRTKLNYPIMLNPQSFNLLAMGHELGGVLINSTDESIVSAKSVFLFYFLVSDESAAHKERAAMWERKVVQEIEKYEKNFKKITPYYVTIRGYGDELDNNIFASIPYIFLAGICTGLFIIFCIAVSGDELNPLLGIVAMTASVFGTISGFGLLLWFKYPCMSLFLSIPFMMMGIGVDDAFVLFAAWRKTDRSKTVEERMGETYSEASVSITITTLTDALSFAVGVFSPLVYINKFCLYAAVSIMFVYLYQLLFLGGAIILCEKRGINRFSFFNSYPVKKPNTSLSSTFVLGLSKLLTKPAFIFIVLSLYFAYLGISLYGAYNISTLFIYRRLFSESSFAYQYDIIEDKYHAPGYFFRPQLIIEGPQGFQDLQRINEEFQYLVSNYSKTDPIFSDNFSENWIQGSQNWLANYVQVFPDFKVTKDTFIDVVRDNYLFSTEFNSSALIPNMPTSTDVAFDEENKNIVATRMILQIYNVTEKVVDRCHALEVMENHFNSAFPDFRIMTSSVWNGGCEVIKLIKPHTIKLVGMAAAVVLIVSLFLIPSFLVNASIFFTVISTEIGVVGMLSLWDVNLDIICVVCLMMCIGFSADFAAHVSYAFSITDTSLPVRSRLEEALGKIAVPVIQGATSSFIASASITLNNSYVLYVFFKTIILVMTFATIHALLVLPVVFVVFSNFKSGIADLYFRKSRCYKVNI